jgi:hypothetical protein
MNWKVNHIKLENRRPYLKSKDIINLSVMGYINSQNTELFLRSHDIQFTIGNDIFQEVVCHNERLGGNDEVSYFILFICKIEYIFILFLLYLVVH